MEVLAMPNSPAHVSAPSTPKRFGDYYFSAPTSPSHLSQFYNDFDELLAAGNGSGGGASEVAVQSNGDDFAFYVNEDFETASLSADELFDGGVIKPLSMPPPRLQLPTASRFSELAKSPSKGKSAFKSPSRSSSSSAASAAPRGRERGINVSKSSSRRAARSLSPLRDAQYPWEEKAEQPHNAQNSSSTTTICSALSVSMKGHKKWRLKDFFLFRSASEGRAADKDPLKKYTAAIRHFSSRAMDSPGSGSGSGSGSRRKGPISAHEAHYTVNRAVSENLKKKTFLPYKQGILGRLSFNPAAHALANGFGFHRK